MKQWFMIELNRLQRRASDPKMKLVVVAAKDGNQAIRGVELMYPDAHVVSIKSIDARTLDQTDLVVPHDI